MQTIHATNGVTGIAHDNHARFYTEVHFKNDIYQMNINPLDINMLADNLAKIDAIVNSNIVVCTSDRLLGQVGVVFNSGIKQAFDVDVYSTKEQRQSYIDAPDIHVDTPTTLATIYPEFWVRSTAVSHIITDKDMLPETRQHLSTLVGMMFGLLVY